jgi:transcriptional regulator with XRE-family HTH domain
MNTIGNKIKYYREKNRLTMSKLAELSGVSQSTISLIESGQRIPNSKTLERLASALNISLDELINNDGIKSEKENELKRKTKVKGILLEGLPTNIRIGVVTEFSPNEEDYEKNHLEALFNIHNFQSPIIQDEIIQFIKENLDTIVDRFTKKVAEESEKVKKSTNQYVNAKIDDIAELK